VNIIACESSVRNHLAGFVATMRGDIENKSNWRLWVLGPGGSQFTSGTKPTTDGLGVYSALR